MSQRKARMTGAQIARLQRDWDAAGELLSLLILGARIEASRCYELDTCTMNGDCPFYAGCMAAEWGTDGSR